MLGHLLDTNLIIELLRGRGGAVTQRMDQAAGALAVSSISVAELEYGVEFGRAAARHSLSS